MTLQHVVALRFSDPLTADEYAEMSSAIKSWPDRIGSALTLRFGADLTGARTRGYSYLLFLEFEDLEALSSYQKHPVHQEFSGWIRAHGGESLVFDYYVDATTSIWPPLTTNQETA